MQRLHPPPAGSLLCGSGAPGAGEAPSAEGKGDLQACSHAAAGELSTVNLTGTRPKADVKHPEPIDAALSGVQAEMRHVEGQVAGLQSAQSSAERHNLQLAERVAAAGEGEARARLEAGAAREELRRVRKDLLKLRDEWNNLRALYEATKVREGWDVYCANTLD